jgi:integrase
VVEIYSGKMKKDGYDDTSRGHYLDILKTFLNWAEQEQIIVRNPIAKMDKPKRDSEKKGIFTPEQFVCLIKTTSEKNILIGRTTGQERAVLYLLTGMTGLRRKEPLNLTWDDISLSAYNASVKVKESITKNGKEAEQPVSAILVNVLTILKATVRPEADDRVFVSFGTWINTAELIREDLRVAKIELTDRKDNEIFFHSLRNSYISFLANSQTPAKVIQKLARHSAPRLTFNTYARTFEEAEQKAMNLLPNFGDFVFATSLAKVCRKQEISVDKQRKKTAKNRYKPHSWPINK